MRDPAASPPSRHDQTRPEAAAQQAQLRSTPPPATAETNTFVGTGVLWGLGVGVLLAVGTIILAAQNTASTVVAFLGWTFSMPLIAIILVCLLVGVVLGELAGLMYRVRRRRVLNDRVHLEQYQHPEPVKRPGLDG